MYKAVLLPFAPRTQMHQPPQVTLTGKKFNWDTRLSKESHWVCRLLSRADLDCQKKQLSSLPLLPILKALGGPCRLLPLGSSLAHPQGTQSSRMDCAPGRRSRLAARDPTILDTAASTVSPTTPPSASVLSPEWPFLFSTNSFLFFFKKSFRFPEQWLKSTANSYTLPQPGPTLISFPVRSILSSGGAFISADEPILTQYC